MYNNRTAVAKNDEAMSGLPTPSGYKILIAIPKLEAKTRGGIIRPDAFKKAEEVASIIGYVVDLGPEAYANKDRFPSGPWCKEKDFVIFRSYSGTRFTYMDEEYRFINDDTVEGVIADPRQFGRAS